MGERVLTGNRKDFSFHGPMFVKKNAMTAERIFNATQQSLVKSAEAQAKLASKWLKEGEDLSYMAVQEAASFWKGTGFISVSSQRLIFCTSKYMGYKIEARSVLWLEIVHCSMYRDGNLFGFYVDTETEKRIGLNRLSAEHARFLFVLTREILADKLH